MNLLCLSRILLSGSLLALSFADADGHGLPIYFSIDTLAGEVVVSRGFDSGVIESHPIFGLSTDLPGLGVLSASDGIVPGDWIGLRATQGLLYWNGTELLPTTATLTVNSAMTIDSFDVNATSGLQDKLDWAIYPQSAGPFWDADSLYQLSDNAAPGIYGLVVQGHVDRIDAVDNPIASQPFVIPFVYGDWSSDQENSGIALLQAAIQRPEETDFNRDWQTDSLDLAIWHTHFGRMNSPTQVQGDADSDADVDGADFLRWQQGVSRPINQVKVLNLPEPTSLNLIGSLLPLTALFRQRRRIF